MQPLAILSCFVACCTLWGAIATFAESPQPPRGELHLVDKTARNRITIRQNFEALVDIKPNGTLAPHLATAWTWRDDHTLDIVVRQGVTFHNGEVLNAAVVKRNIDMYMVLRDFWGADRFWRAFPPGTRAEVLDDKTVRLVLPEPDSTAVARLFLMRITNHQFYDTMKSPKQYWVKLNKAGPWGTGPYKFVKGHSQGVHRSNQLVFEANLNYWDPERFPQVQRILYNHAIKQQYCGQNLGRLFGNNTIVAKGFVLRAGFFQTQPVS